MTEDPTLTRPLMRYHGGKWKLAPWIIEQFPGHRVYVEPFGGAASVLLRKPRSYAEVVNDLSGDVVNLYRAVRDSGEQLVRALEMTPFAREEFELAYQPTDDPLERARRMIVKAYMGFGSSAATRGYPGATAPFRPTTGFRADSNKSGTPPAADWRSYPDALRAIVHRFRGVVIEHKDAREVMTQHDSPETLHYVDPPYPQETRNPGHDYHHELTSDDHRAIAAHLHTLAGPVIVSGYACPLYDEELYPGWERIEKTGPFADGARERTEVLWMRNVHMDLFRRTQT